MKTILAIAMLSLPLIAVPASARQGDLSGKSDPAVSSHFLMAGNVAYGPGEGAQVHDGWG